jgi:hypothetical protein
MMEAADRRGRGLATPSSPLSRAGDSPVKKLKLDIESVRVESFETGENANRGTATSRRR